MPLNCPVCALDICYDKEVHLATDFKTIVKLWMVNQQPLAEHATSGKNAEGKPDFQEEIQDN